MNVTKPLRSDKVIGYQYTQYGIKIMDMKQKQITKQLIIQCGICIRLMCLFFGSFQQLTTFQPLWFPEGS